MSLAHNADDLVRIIDSLLEELEQLAQDPQTPPGRLMNQAVETIAALAGPDKCSLYLRGPEDQALLAAGQSRPLAEYVGTTPDIWETAQVGHPWESKSGDRAVLVHGLAGTSQTDGLLAVELGATQNQQAARSLIQAVAELVSGFLASQIQQNLQSTDYLQQLAAFTQGCLSSNDPAVLSKVLANDLRVLFQCERVQLFECRPGKIKLRAVSSVAVFEQRTALLRASRQLAQLSLSQTKPLVSFQPPESKTARSALEDYLELSGMNSVTLFPLRAANLPGTPSSSARAPVGVILLEFSEPPELTELARTANLTLPPAAAALDNAQRVSAIPLAQLWMGLARRMNLPFLAKVTAGLLLPALLIALTLIIQGDFKVRIQGTLETSRQQTVFAPHDAFVDEVLVEQGQPVQQGDLLLRLRSPALTQELEATEAEIIKLTEFQADKSIALNQAATGNVGDRSLQARLASEIADLEFQIKSQQDQRDYLRRQLSELAVYAPITGRVVTWDLQRQLRDKPVRWGDPLLKLADENSPWLLRMHAPETRVGYILSSREDSPNLPVEYFLESAPQVRYQTQLGTVADATENDPDWGPGVAMDCPVAPDQPTRRHGAKVVGDVDCGRRPLAYLWTYQLRDAIRRQFVW